MATLADNGYQGEATEAELMADAGLTVQIVKRPDGLIMLRCDREALDRRVCVWLARTLPSACQGHREPLPYPCTQESKLLLLAVVGCAHKPVAQIGMQKWMGAIQSYLSVEFFRLFPVKSRG